MPQTVEDLGKLVKQKYPGTYDSLSDADLGVKVKAKYPQYSNFEDAPAAPAAPQGEGFWKSLWDQANPMPALKSAIGTDELASIHGDVSKGNYKDALLKAGEYMTQGPAGRIASGIVQGSAERGANAVAQAKQGNTGEAALSAVEAVPFVGPVAGKTVRQVGQGDYAGAAGTLVGAAAPALIEGGPSAARAIARGSAAVADVTSALMQKPGTAATVKGAALGTGALMTHAAGIPFVPGILTAEAVRNIAKGEFERRAGRAPVAAPVERTPTALENFINDANTTGRATLPESTAPAPPPIPQQPPPMPEAAPAPIEAPTEAVAPPPAPVPQPVAAPVAPAPIVRHDPMPIRLADAAFKAKLAAKGAEPAPVVEPPVEAAQAPVAETPEEPMVTVPDAPIPKAWLNQETTGLQVATEQHNRTEVARKVAKQLVNDGYKAMDLVALRKTDPEAYANLLEGSTKYVSKQAKQGKDYSASPDTQARIMFEMRKIQPRTRTKPVPTPESPSVASPSIVERLKQKGAYEDAQKLAEMMK